ncbi:hypothetical protein BHM03_00034042 [Ensete ventricosum]|nr:hypothetical protein BHM03_00034042 [Ensete ventricosum]
MRFGFTTDFFPGELMTNAVTYYKTEQQNCVVHNSQQQTDHSMSVIASASSAAEVCFKRSIALSTCERTTMKESFLCQLMLRPQLEEEEDDDDDEDEEQSLLTSSFQFVLAVMTMRANV